MKRSIWVLTWALVLAALAGSVLTEAATAEQRVPGEVWMRYADPAQAGFDAAKLAAAEERWKELPSSAFLVVSDGAVVASWGEVDRRFMCHSVRKSFLSALFGIYWDRGEIDLNKTMADLGIDEGGDGLLETERRARILDLLKARSGVFHPAAYAGRTDSRPRGSEGPGRYFAYNNWDFNTLAAILEIETGDTVFEAFDEHFGQPLAMEDWRVSDGYFHYERDKSVYPAYPFRLSARDAARFGLLFARDGVWGDQRVLSRHWVRRSTALYSIDSEVMGYGFMWWVARQPPLSDVGFVAALGVGNQMIAVMPDIDLVIVNRANTYGGEGTPLDDLLGLVGQVVEARVGEPAAEPRLEPLGSSEPGEEVTRVPAAELAEFVGEWPLPPAPLGLPPETSIDLQLADGHLTGHVPDHGTFAYYLQPDGWLIEEDSGNRYLPIRDQESAFAGAADPGTIARAAVFAAIGGDAARADQLIALVADPESLPASSTGVLIDLASGRDGVDAEASALLERFEAPAVENRFNNAGYQLLQADQPALAQKVFELNTRLFPESFNTWDSLAESHMMQRHAEDAIRFYRKSLELNPENSNADRMIERIQKAVEESSGDS